MNKIINTLLLVLVFSTTLFCKSASAVYVPVIPAHAGTSQSKPKTCVPYRDIKYVQLFGYTADRRAILNGKETRVLSSIDLDYTYYNIYSVSSISVGYDGCSDFPSMSFWAGADYTHLQFKTEADRDKAVRKLMGR